MHEIYARGCELVVGVLQGIFANSRSNDVVCSSGYNKMVPYDLWDKQINGSSAGKSGPVTTIAVNKAEIDRVLDELGVVQRERRGSKNARSVSRNLFVRDNG